MQNLKCNIRKEWVMGLSNYSNVKKKKYTYYYNNYYTYTYYSANLCYMNSSIQCLAHLKDFADWILNYNKDDDLIKATQKLFFNMKQKDEPKNSSVIEIKGEMAKLDKRYETDNQQDANEFISLFLNEILLKTQGSREINNIFDQLKGLEKKAFDKLWKRFYLKKGRSYMVDLFYGILKTETKKIDNDELISVNFHMYNMLELPLYFLDKECSDIDLNDILKNYLEKKNNDDGETYDRTIIYKMPEYLIIFFNRKNNEEYLNIDINYNFEEDFSDYCPKNSGNHKYKLSGIIHYGSDTSDYGHYTATCKVGNDWYFFNDSFISKEEKKEEFYKNVIILFYSKKKK